MTVRLYRQAESDLEEIYRYIARDNGAAAERTTAAILKALQVLELFPMAGRPRDELFEGLRSWPVGHCTAFYFIEEGEVGVARILGAGQDVTLSAISDTL